MNTLLSIRMYSSVRILNVFVDIEQCFTLQIENKDKNNPVEIRLSRLINY